MTAFLKIDRCRVCQQSWPWEWVPPVHLRGRYLAGTGVWRSVLEDELCTRCSEAIDEQRWRLVQSRRLRNEFIRLVGGMKPYREFAFERFAPTPLNQAAFDCAQAFDPSKGNLYLWGPCGVGKTHLAVAILRRWFARGYSGAMLTPFQLVRRLRMKAPEEEQREIDTLINSSILVLDDLAAGGSIYERLALCEVLEGRERRDRTGLIVTSLHSPALLGRRSEDRSVVSRLLGLCHVVEIKGADRRSRLEGCNNGDRR